MTTARQFLLGISADLGDQADGGGPLSQARWPLARLLDYLNEGYSYIASSLRPNDFTAIKDVALTTGSMQDVRGCGCTRVLKVGEQVSATGATIARLDNPTEARVAKSTDWADWSDRLTPSRAPTGQEQHTLSSAYRDMNSASTFYVLPAVPPMKPVYVRILCAGVVPDILGPDTDIEPNKYLAPLRHYVMAAALGTEAESTGDSAASRDHFDRFMKLASAGYQREEATPRVINTGNGPVDA